jgi:hypothetical protein
MLQIGRYVRIGVVAGLSCLLPTAASAGDLHTPTIAASIAAAADWASTYHALKHYELRETNPLIRRFEHTPGAMISLGAVMDAGLVSGWNVAIGRKHPKVAVTGLWAMTVFRAYLTVHNLRNARKAARRAAGVR